MANDMLDPRARVSEPIRNWREQDGIIYFSVTSNGMRDYEWLRRFDSEGGDYSGLIRRIVNRVSFTPTSGTTTVVAVLRHTLFGADGVTMKSVRIAAGRRRFATPSAEVAFLISEKFKHGEIEAMGLDRIVVMHEPIIDYHDDDSYFLCATYGFRHPYLIGLVDQARESYLTSFREHSNPRWQREEKLGFAFVLP